MTAPLVRADDESISRAAEILRRGGVLITPTVTNYNLVGDATNPSAVARIFEIKRRTKLGPLLVSLPHARQITRYVTVPEHFPLQAFEALLPGEVSFIFWQRYPFPDQLTCGLRTVGVSVTSHPVFRSIVLGADRPVAATSANISGQGSIHVDLEKAVEDLGESVDLIVDGGRSGGSSRPEHPHRVNTVVDFTFDRPYLCRPGWVPTVTLREWFPDLVDDLSLYQVRLGERAAAVGAGADGP